MHSVGGEGDNDCVSFTGALIPTLQQPRDYPAFTCSEHCKSFHSFEKLTFPSALFKTYLPILWPTCFMLYMIYNVKNPNWSTL